MASRTVSGKDLLWLQGVEIDPDKLYDIEVKLHRQKRSLNANAYAWKLIGEIAKALNSTPREIYRQYVRDYGLYRDWTIPESQKATFEKVWQSQGIGWVTEIVDYAENEDDYIIRAYYGTSSYNTKQMSRIINAIVADCVEMGIETKDPNEVDSLLKEWKSKI